VTSLDLSFHVHTDGDPNQLRERLESFRQTHRNIELPITVLPWDTAWSDLVRIALYKDGADLSEVGTTWLGSFVGMDALRPFTLPELSKLGGAAAFLPASWQNGSLIGDQAQWGIPWLADTRVIFYWREMFEQAGIDEASAFHSFAQMQDTLARLQANGISTPWAVPTRNTHNTLYNIASWVWAAGGDFVTPDSAHIAINQADAKAGMQAYFDLYRFMPQQTAPMDGFQTIRLFEEQRLAAVMSGPWFLGTMGVHGMTPDTLARIGVALPPGPSFVGGTMLAIWKHLPHGLDQTAIDLIRYLVTDVVWQDYYFRSGMLPARLDLLAQPPFSTDPHYQVITRALQQGRTHARLPMWGLIEERLTTALAQIWNEVRAAPQQDVAALIGKYIDPLAQRLEATLTGGAAHR
jgi:multiple sugar transport system substrate-binding protein